MDSGGKPESGGILRQEAPHIIGPPTDPCLAFDPSVPARPTRDPAEVFMTPDSSRLSHQLAGLSERIFRTMAALWRSGRLEPAWVSRPTALPTRRRRRRGRRV